MKKIGKVGLALISVLLLGSVFGIGMSGATIDVTVADIVVDSNTGFGAANASICVTNHSRLFRVWVDGNISNETVVTLGKDGQYVEFNDTEYLVIGISPEWNQTIEMYVKGNSSFEIWGEIGPGSVWRNNQWEIDNPNQLNQRALLGIVTIKNEIIVDSSGYGQGMYTLKPSETVLVGVYLNPGPQETEVFVGTDEVGVAVWEDQKKDCWILEKEVIIHVETDSEEDFDVCGRFLFADRTFGVHTLCHVNASAVREMHRGEEGKTWG